MDQVCLVIPVLQGQSDDARAFMREIEESRRAEYERSAQRLEIPKEVWYLADLGGSDGFIAYIEARNFAEALTDFSQSQDDFDLWFKRRLADSTGVDLNNPPEMALPELLFSYDAQPAAVR
jgi:hypothetical protein